MSAFENPKVIDEATVRNKLNEYAKAGILISARDGRRVVYRRPEDNIDLERWQDAIAFFSEIDPVGVIGSFLLDKMQKPRELFSYKHHYILHALESDIICTLLDAISDDCTVDIELISKKNNIMKFTVLPFKICLSTENGRGYLLARRMGSKRFSMYRLDRINSVVKGAFAEEKAEAEEVADSYTHYLWNASGGDTVDHLEMTLRIEEGEDYILQRLLREGKHGHVEPVGENRYKFVIDVYDAKEMLPWLRTFIGRIEELTCSNPDVVKVFYEDLDELHAIYCGTGGDGDAV